MNALYRVTAFWYTRILLFVLPAVFGPVVYALIFVIPGQGAVYAFLLVLSLAIEQGRPCGAWYTFGVQPRYMLRQIAGGLLLGTGFIVLIGCGAWLAGARWQAAVTPGLPGALHTLSVLALYAAGEEIVFRGIVFQSLYERFGGPVAILVTSLPFAIAHFANPGVSVVAVLNLILVGILFALMYIHTRSLWLPWAFHLSWNAAQMYLLGSPVSGLYFGQPLLELVPVDSGIYRLWIGGAFGIESGLATTVLLLAGLGLVSLPWFAQVAPELAARLFRRRYAEALVTDVLRFPWSRVPEGGRTALQNPCP